MATRIRLTLEQGTALLRVAYNVRYPKKLGDKLLFPVREQSTIADELRALKKALQKHSPIFTGRDRKIFFGPITDGNRELYRRTEKQLDRLSGDMELQVSKADLKVQYELLEPFHEVEVELSGAAKKGVYRVLLLWLHPESEELMNSGKQDEIAWPVAEAIPGFVEKLRADTERDKAGQPPDEDDAEVTEPAAEKAGA